MISKSKTYLAAAAVSLGAGFATPSLAAPAFQITQSALGGFGGLLTADQLNSGGASTLLALNEATGTITGNGYLAIGSFSYINAPVVGAFVNATYALWAEFTYTTQYNAALSGGNAFGTGGSQYNITSLSFDLYGEVINGNNVVFNQGSLAGTAPSVTHSPDTTKLAAGTLISGIAAFNSGGGASFNPIIALALTSGTPGVDGDEFFTQPVPFYNIALSSFTNDSNGFATNFVSGSGKIGYTLLTNAAGQITFENSNLVPEPATLALLGLGLVGLASVRRNRASNS